jgi:pyruvate/2-oxoglutarate dehydrogenase complex dihydrolipoamide acyltransferase (E2) component
MNAKKPHKIEPIPAMRRFSIDAGYMARRRNMVHGLLEVDVTDARRLIREHREKTGTGLSFTAFVLYCLSRAIEQHPHVHAYRDWRNRLVIYEDVNITCMFEAEFGSKKTPMPHVFSAANRKTLLEIHEELRETQIRPHGSAESGFMRWFLFLPAFVRRAFYAMVMRFPQTFRDYSSPVMVTAVGMFGGGGGWVLTNPNFTLNVAVGGITAKPGVYNGEVAIREYLDLTISLDHDVVDGAPAARFGRTFRTLLESASGLQDLSG